MKYIYIALLFIGGASYGQTFDPLSMQRMPPQTIVGNSHASKNANAVFLKLDSCFELRNDSLFYNCAGASIDTSNAFINYITRVPGVDSIYFNIGGTWYAVKDSVGTGGGGSYTFSTGLTNSGGTVTNNISTGIANGQRVIGGVNANDTLTLVSNTASSGNTAANLAMNFRVGNNGATVAQQILQNGKVGFGGTPSAQVQYVLTDDGAPSTVTSWDSRHVQWGLGGSTAAGLGVSYSSGTSMVNLNFLQPGIAWKNGQLNFQTLSFNSGGTTIGFYQNSSGSVSIGSSTATSRFNVGTSQQFQINSTGNIIQAPSAYFGGAGTPTANIHLAAGTASVSTAPLKLTTGTSLTTSEPGAFEYTTPQLFFTNGGAIRQEIPQIQQSRVSTQYDETDETLGNITGLTANVAAGKTYRFEATLYTTSDVGGGIKVAIGGTATATAIIYEGLTTNAGLTTQSRATALGSAVGAVTAVTAAYITITGTITVNAAGTLTVQSARNAAVGTTSVLVGSTFVITEMN